MKTKQIQRSEEIRERLNQKLSELDEHTQGILEKIEQGEYLGQKMGLIDSKDLYTLNFDSVGAFAISNQTKTATLDGSMTFTTFDKGKKNLKLEVDSCQIKVDGIEYSCGFGKARTSSLGQSGEKDSLVIIAFLEDSEIEELHTTLKIFLNADVPISEMNQTANIQILKPQSKISHLWFLEGVGTLTKTSLPDTDVDDTDETEVN